MNLAHVLISIWLLCGLACALWLQHWVRENRFKYRPAPLGLFTRLVDVIVPIIAGPIGLVFAAHRIYKDRRRKQRMMGRD